MKKREGIPQLNAEGIRDFGDCTTYDLALKSSSPHLHGLLQKAEIMAGARTASIRGPILFIWFLLEYRATIDTPEIMIFPVHSKAPDTKSDARLYIKYRKNFPNPNYYTFYILEENGNS